MLELFLNYLRAVRGLSENTVNGYKFDLMMFFRANGYEHPRMADLEAITLEILHQFIADMEREGKGDATRARAISSLRQFFKYLCLTEILEKDPTTSLESPKLAQKVPIYLSLEQSEALIKSVEKDPKTYAIVVVFLNCGLRISELCRLDVQDVTTTSILVTGKGDKQRYVPMNAFVKKVLKDYLVYRQRQPGPMFLNRDGTPISPRAVENLLKKVFEDLGLTDFTPHKLRHTAATLMHKYGHVDIRTLQQFLGHASIASTQIYMHVDDGQLQEAAESNPLCKKKKGGVKK